RRPPSRRRRAVRGARAPRTRSRRRAIRSSRPRRLLDRAHDAVVAGAAAEVAHHPFGDQVVGRTRVRAEQRGRRDDLARGADAALEAALGDERLLQRGQRARRDPLDGRHRGAVDEERRYETSREQLAVDEHAARAAHADRAPLLRPGQAADVAHEIDEPRGGGHAYLALLAVQAEADRVVAHGRRSLKRWTFPVDVFGSSVRNSTHFGCLHAESASDANASSSAASAPVGRADGTTYAQGRTRPFSSVRATTAASRTAGWRRSAASTSMGETQRPLTRIMSSERP